MAVKPTARTCHYCGKTHGVDKFRQEINGKSVVIWAHLACFLRKRKQDRRRIGARLLNVFSPGKDGQ